MADDNADFSPRTWLELALLADVPREAKLAWLKAFGSPGAVLRQGVAALGQVHPVARPLAGVVAAADLDAVLDWGTASGGTCMFPGDEAYPAALAAKFDVPPLAIFARGDLRLLDMPMVTLLGAPRPSARGLARARTFAHELAQEGIVVAAGISPGIAQAAHHGVQAAAGKSLGVVGDARAWEGVRLAEDVSGGGLLLSELAPRVRHAKSAYAQRHRMLAGLANLVVVIEAPASCDTLKLAALSGDMGCDVAAVPSDPDDAQLARGGNLLLREGAALVETSADIVALLGVQGI